MKLTEEEMLLEKLKAECVKRSRFGGCRMECDIFKSKMGYCKTVWQNAARYVRMKKPRI